MTRPDAVIVKPGSQKQLYQTLGAFSLTAVEPPLFGALLAADLRQKGFGVELIDAEIEGLDYAETARMIHALAPRLAVVSVSGTNPSASTMNMTGAGQILRHLKQLDPTRLTIMTGLHVTALPERTLTEEVTDFVCLGEGFYTLPVLIETLKCKGDVSAIRGLAFRDKQGIPRVNPPAPLVSNLDLLPMPAWDLLPMEKYRAHNWHCLSDLRKRTPYAVVYTSLGCPFKCTFCCVNALFGKSGIRLRSKQQVIEEIDILVNRYGISNIKIIDEMFALNKTHVHGICDAIVKRGYELNLFAYARVNTVDEEMLSDMKKAGIHWVAYGYESANEAVLKGVAKGFTRAQALDVSRVTKEVGIHINGNFIFGLPDDTLETMTETLEMAMEINPEWANLYSAMAYPGSKLYEDAVNAGLPLPASWADYSQYGAGAAPLPTRTLDGRAVLAFRDRAFERYYTRPAYLRMIEATFGKDARRHIETMVATPLSRTG